MPAIRTVSGDLPTGSSLYAARCAVCHGEKTEGKREFASPSLNRLEGWYFLDQMRKFRNGMRGRHELDFGGQVMAAAVAGLTKQQMYDVVAYVVNTFGPPEAPSLRQRFEKRALESNASKK
jgi:cytochrome c553